VAGAVSEMAAALDRIYTAAGGQKDDIAEVRAAAEAVNEMAAGNGASSREAAEAIGEARGQLASLLDGLARFRLPGQDAAATTPTRIEAAQDDAGAPEGGEPETVDPRRAPPQGPQDGGPTQQAA
ncbi:MAG: hypothetical protein ACU0BS_11070, partial [Hasllibacter sp.]